LYNKLEYGIYGDTRTVVGIPAWWGRRFQIVCSRTNVCRFLGPCTGKPGNVVSFLESLFQMQVKTLYCCIRSTTILYFHRTGSDNLFCLLYCVITIQYHIRSLQILSVSFIPVGDNISLAWRWFHLPVD
jgi:hypothetical protein